jgi:hypothetical protein
MNLEKLNERKSALFSALDGAKKEILDLNERLERSKTTFNMLSGNINEISFIISQMEEEKNNVKIDEQATTEPEPTVPPVTRSELK